MKTILLSWDVTFGASFGPEGNLFFTVSGTVWTRDDEGPLAAVGAACNLFGVAPGKLAFVEVKRGNSERHITTPDPETK